MIIDRDKIRLMFKILVWGYILITILTFAIPLLGVGAGMGGGMGSAAAGFVIFALAGIVLAVVGVYFMWMLLNLVLDMHEKVSRLAGEVPQQTTD